MTIQDLQKFIETNLPVACVPVDLLKIAKSIYPRMKILEPRGRIPQSGTLSLVVDGECCLDRLYGGYFSDWVCGGQWNRMLHFLSVLIQTVKNNNIELAVFFNGALEQQRMIEWTEAQCNTRKNINAALKHVSMKGTPPPKIWWTAPVGLRTCLRMALRYLNVQVFCTMDDHHQEVIAYCRENNYHGLMAEDPEYIIFDPPRYFSSQQLKLTYKGSLETKEFILDEISRGLCLNRNYFCFLATLMGNYQLKESDLQEFYATLIPNYNKDKISQEQLIKAIAEFIVNYCDVNNLTGVAIKIFGSPTDPRVSKFKESVHYFLNGTKGGFLQYSILTGRRDPLIRQGYAHNKTNGTNYENNLINTNGDSDALDNIPLPLPDIPHEIIRTASERHQKALMCPWIYQVLTQGEIKFPPCMEEQFGRDLPNIVLFYRPIRQHIYAILFNQHHTTFLARKAKEQGQKPADVPPIKIKEWLYTKDNHYKKPDIVQAVPINWAVPTVHRLWFGSIIDDKKRRLRAFLSCMRSDSPLMLNSNYVPQQFLILATVLRYILTYPGGSVLRNQEIDAFLVTAFSSDLTKVFYLQDLQIPVVSSRAVQLASLLMMGIETALFANDACGAPIPWLMCFPWQFFDGKLFHYKLHQANNARSLVEVCDGDMDLVMQVDNCRKAIFEGLHSDYLQPHFGPGPNMRPMDNHSMRPMDNHMHGPPYNSYNFIPHHGGRGRNRGGYVNNSGHLYARGGQLQVAGVVVGSWGPNYGTNSSDKMFSQNGRGSGYYRGNMGRGRIDPRHFSRPRGRPSVLAKRRTISLRKKETKSPKSHGSTNDNSEKKETTTKEILKINSFDEDVSNGAIEDHYLESSN